MHNLSFISKNPVFEFNGLKFSIQVFTHENCYEISPKDVCESKSQDIFIMKCSRLTWAGGQEFASGSVNLRAEKSGMLVRFFIQAKHNSEVIRCLKLKLIGIRNGSIAGLRMPDRGPTRKEVPADGFILKYPNGFDGLYSPLLILKHNDGDFTYFRSLDTKVRPKTFALLPADKRLDVELIFEESAIEFKNSIDVPAWEIGINNDYKTIMKEQTGLIEQNYGLVEWEKRSDVPGWAKKISLVVSVHCQHWTGYIFNNYKQVLDNLKWIADKIEPERVLVYLPGWEGRYYWQYGNFRPDPRMGGEAGFQRLIDGASETGMHVMPMFMINGANPRTAGFKEWGEPSIYVSAGGFKQIWGSCDWDTSRHYDHNCGLPLNPGAPLWQDRLVGQINGLIDQYGFHGVFLDLAAVYINDPRYDTYKATIDIAGRIRENHPDILMAGEGWYDAVSASMPLTQPSLVMPGDTVWSDGPYAPLFDKYNRCFGHLGTGDPSRGSTGCFEWGYNYKTQKVPFRKGIIPTVTIVDGTIENAPEKVEDIIGDAKRYAEEFL